MVVQDGVRHEILHWNPALYGKPLAKEACNWLRGEMECGMDSWFLRGVLRGFLRCDRGLMKHAT